MKLPWSSTAFDEAEYLALNPDVEAAVRKGQFRSGREHYEKHGKQEGRETKRSVGPTSREKKVFHLLDKEGLGLEIGPSHNPIAPKKKGYKVHVLDHASAEDLRSKYQAHGVNLSNIEDVDFVWNGEPLHELIGKTNHYDWIIASHVIEHTPDLITFLSECEKLLRPEGVLSLVIPDKRYCFDYFNAVTSTGDLLDAFVLERKRPSPGKVFDQIARAAKRGGKIAWGPGDHGQVALAHSFAEASALWERARTTSEYIDVHSWRFTPSSFRLLVSDLQKLGLIGLCLAKEFDTEGCEFYAALRKAPPTSTEDRLALLTKARMEESSK